MLKKLLRRSKPMNNKLAPVIIKKKCVPGHGGHSGDWKVAYADFVIAIMAFFLALWILGLSEAKRKAIAGYFRAPNLFEQKSGSEKLMQLASPEQVQIIEVNDTSDDNSTCDLSHPESCPGDLAKNYQLATLGQKLKDKLEVYVENNSELAELKGAVIIELTRSGLCVEMTDSERATFFQVGGARPTKAATLILKQIAQELVKLPNLIELEGHTDRRPYPSSTYTNWEISAERANAARRALDLSGVKNIIQVSGFADTKLRNSRDPYDISNRRVSVIVRQ
jgi:chemotaxis protein MotB